MGLSILSVIFALLTYVGAWRGLRGDNLVADVAARFDKSYAEGASNPVRPDDKEWKPLIRIISRYTNADLPRDLKPVVFARFAAISSAKVEAGDKVLAEWTAPTTPVALLYKEWPGHGSVSPEFHRVVGTIQDLHEWVRKDEADFDFLVRTIIFGLLSASVGVFLALRS